ncbi:MAG: rare lipoprotein [Actinomycetota bacterium]|nr:rare lipoprotein [Actinomycetota bacterium]
MTMHKSWAAGIAVLLIVTAVTTGTAGATDIEELRSRAQELGDRVTKLEEDLATLSSRESALRKRMDQTSAAIGILELEKHELDARYEEANGRFIARAVEAYKSGPTSNVEMLLGARTVSQALTLAEAQVRAADKDARALDELEQARVDADEQQAAIDQRKQEIVHAHLLMDAVVNTAQTTVDERRRVLEGVVAEIQDLEEQARLAAAAAARPTAAFLRLLAPSGPAPDIPDGFVGTGVSFEGVASWYGPGFEGNHTASGDVFDSDLYTAASRDLPLGTWLFVTYGGRGVVVLINDRGPYVDDRVLDLSHAAAEALGISGLGWIEAELLIQT